MLAFPGQMTEMSLAVASLKFKEGSMMSRAFTVVGGWGGGGSGQMSAVQRSECLVGTHRFSEDFLLHLEAA